MPSHAEEVTYVTLISTFWFFFLYWLSWRCAPYLAKQNPPIALPLIVLSWTLVTFPSLVVWVRLKAPTGGFKSNTNWFAVGWSANINFFNIAITNWWTYELLMVYNLGRTVLGSLVSNVFRPMLMIQQSRILTSELQPGDAALYVFGQSVVTVFGFFSAVTDLYLLLTQIDISVVSLLATLLMDGGATWMILAQRFSKAPPDKAKDARGRLPSASAGAFKRSLPQLRGVEEGYKRLLESA
jgi:hypothetical protein